jgi:hypothetical protein
MFALHNPFVITFGSDVENQGFSGYSGFLHQKPDYHVKNSKENKQKFKKKHKGNHPPF